MCIKTYGVFSSSSSNDRTTKALNPNAQEWRPTKNHLSFISRRRRRCLPPRRPFNSCHVPVTRWVGENKAYPPRLRRAMLPFEKEKKVPPRLEWKPRKSGRRASAAAAATGEFSPPSSKTTVMIKNIPNNLRRDFMLEFMDSFCKSFSLEYDFLYLPMDFRQMDNFGYAFVNMTSGAAAHKLKQVLHNFKWNTVRTRGGKFMSSRKICHVTWARIQGKEGLVRRFKNSIFACDNPGYLPVLLDPPRNGSDPSPPPPLVVGRLCGGGG